jgi:hypothetical protein
VQRAFVSQCHGTASFNVTHSHFFPILFVYWTMISRFDFVGKGILLSLTSIIICLQKYLLLVDDIILEKEYFLQEFYLECQNAAETP